MEVATNRKSWTISSTRDENSDGGSEPNRRRRSREKLARKPDVTGPSDPKGPSILERFTPSVVKAKHQSRGSAAISGIATGKAMRVVSPNQGIRSVGRCAST